MDNEAAFSFNFSAFMAKKAKIYNWEFHAFPVGHQDVELGADFVISDSTRYSIIEFKASHATCVAENRKWRRRQLCEKLDTTIPMRVPHDKCHFISWVDLETGIAKVNIYRHEACNQSVFGQSSRLLALEPLATTRMLGSQFAEGFFKGNSEFSLSREEFKAYVKWVMKETSGSQEETLRFLVSDPTSQECVQIPLFSIEQVHAWMQKYPSQNSSNTPSTPQTQNSGLAPNAGNVADDSLDNDSQDAPGRGGPKSGI
ncbi:hypothetical protein F506_20145 [Herbaspirillum hiltneri N3]|uniref:NERD domain-containing protein n=1 Tax=Herbaspirillum hiltneri N3 TaxID=1262470 RepID=A0ABM5V518_9BURK|nr:hypothetical protein [Herbaspirillum hiltneri]AKZ64656.1 hypothetical protein F506_20145 [Herbaspirillum hiltneri N3]